MLTSIHFDDETYSDEIKRRLMKSLPVADVALLRLTVRRLASGADSKVISIVHLTKKVESKLLVHLPCRTCAIAVG